MTRQKPIEAKPQLGGRLLSALSGENIGIWNYEIKRDIRRDLDKEKRSEGDVLFCPKVYDIAGVPSIIGPATTDPITLIVQLTHPNNRKMIIVGTATTLWRYYGRENALYYEPVYFEPDYYEETSEAWKEIGSGFTSPARRWEAELLNGWLILNNGVDLPVTYRITDDVVTPIHELRELAIASVGTIVVQNGHLLVMDIRQIKEDKFIELMTPVSSAVAGSVRGAYSSDSTDPLIPVATPPGPIFGNEDPIFGNDDPIFGT